MSGCDACLVYLVETETGEFVLRASLVPHAADLGTLRMKIGEGVTGWVAEHQSPVALASNAAADPRFKMFPALMEDTYEAFLSVPLVNKGKAIGVINVHHRDQHEHSVDEIATISFIGEQMGSAIAKSLARRRERAAVGGNRGDEAAAGNAQGGGARQGHPATPPQSDRRRSVSADAQ